MRPVSEEIFSIKHWLLKPAARGAFLMLQRNQYLQTHELAAVNWSRRIRLLEYAVNYVPYYRELFKQHGLRVEDIQKAKDWERVPILGREALADSKDKLVASCVAKRHLAPSTTGGSTGHPVTVFHDRRYPQEVLGWRMLGWWGIRPGIDMAMVGRMPHRNALEWAANRTIWWPTRRAWLDASSMDAVSMGAFCLQYNRLRHPVLQGYVGALQHLAEYVLKNSVAVKPPQAIWATAAPLTASAIDIIESAFGAPVYDQYGCCEILWLAAQCKERTGLHVFQDARYLEIINENGEECGDGVEGRVVVTDLENYAFPLIRYELGDRATMSSKTCRCGVTLPLINPVKGRIADMLSLPSGRTISGEYLTTIFDAMPATISSFQVVQRRNLSILLKVAPRNRGQEFDAAVAGAVSALQTKTRNEVYVECEIVPTLQATAGKPHYIIRE